MVREAELNACMTYGVCQKLVGNYFLFKGISRKFPSIYLSWRQYSGSQFSPRSNCEPHICTCNHFQGIVTSAFLLLSKRGASGIYDSFHLLHCWMEDLLKRYSVYTEFLMNNSYIPPI